MAQEKKEGMLSRLDTKQKVIAVVFVVIVLVILWQVMSLFGGGGSTPTPPPQAQQTETMGSTPPTATPPSTEGTPPAATTAVAPAPRIKEVPVTPTDNAILEIEKQSQKKYIDTLNQLQLLKVQRDIAETNQAIAVAKLATVTAEKSVSDLLTKPAPPIVPTSAYSNLLITPAQSGAAVPTQPPTAEAVVTPPAPTLTGPTPAIATPSSTSTTQTEVQYSVISVSMQLGKWTAVIGYQGKLYSVAIGDVLPADKSVVKSINRNTVVLEKDGKKRTINIISSI